jgi:hypothetical protein
VSDFILAVTLSRQLESSSQQAPVISIDRSSVRAQHRRLLFGIVFVGHRASPEIVEGVTHWAKSRPAVGRHLAAEKGRDLEAVIGRSEMGRKFLGGADFRAFSRAPAHEFDIARTIPAFFPRTEVLVRGRFFAKI